MKVMMAKYKLGDIVQRVWDGAIFAVYGSWVAEVDLPMATIRPHLLVRKLMDDGQWSAKLILIEVADDFLTITGRWIE